MSELVANCPRCGANKITFGLVHAIVVGRYYDWQNEYEAFCICRACRKSTVFVLKDSVDADYRELQKVGLTKVNGAVNPFVRIEGFISLKDRVGAAPPEHVPDHIAQIFREGATCFAVGCNNAAAAMFRLCVDLVTKTFLPAVDADGLNNRIRRNLGLRLPWLFEQGLLPGALRELSGCIKDNGNDGAHDGTVTREDAADLLDFTSILFERIYTEPERIRLAQERRAQRHTPDA
jgi:hypothetical protein